MADNLLFSLNVVAPVFIIIAFGFLLGRKKILTEEFIDVGERFVYNIALPVLVFLQIANSELTVIADFKLILFSAVFVTASFVAVSIGAFLFVRAKKMRGSFVQGACRSNSAILGIPLAQNMFGAEGLALMAVLLPVITLLFNVYSVILFFVFHRQNEKKSVFGTLILLVKNVLTNPLIIAVILGLPFMLWDITIPSFASTALGYVADLTAPLALLCIGAGFKMSSLKGRAVYAVCASVIKIIIMPLAGVAVAVLLGWRGAALAVLFVLFGTPAAISSYIMAKSMNGDGDLAAQILLFTTVFCSLTIFAGTFLLRTLGLI